MDMLCHHVPGYLLLLVSSLTCESFILGCGGGKHGPIQDGGIADSHAGLDVQSPTTTGDAYLNADESSTDSVLIGPSDSSASATLDAGNSASPFATETGGYFFDFEETVNPWVGGIQKPEGYASQHSIGADTVAPFYFIFPNIEEFHPYKISFWFKGQGKMSFGFVNYNSTEWTPSQIVLRHPLEQSVLIKQGMGVTFYPVNAFLVDDVRIEKQTTNEYAAYSDAIVASLGGDVRKFEGGLETRLKRLPQTLNVLQNGGTLRIVLLGDSLVNNLSYGAFDALVMRSFPNVVVQPIQVVANQTGVQTWAVADLKTSLYNKKPNLIFIGGISNTLDPEPWAALISQIRQNLPNADILLSSRTKGGDGGESSHAISTIAEANETGFIDSAASFDAFLADYKPDISKITSDGVHLTPIGREIPARALAWFLGASPLSRQ